MRKPNGEYITMDECSRSPRVSLNIRRDDIRGEESRLGGNVRPSVITTHRGDISRGKVKRLCNRINGRLICKVDMKRLITHSLDTTV